MTTRAIIQARMGSKRLRGKSLTPVAGKTLLQQVVESINGLSFVDEVIVATTDLNEDNPIEASTQLYGVSCFRGDAQNVLKRFVEASIDLEEQDHIVRITADNPLNWHQVSAALHAHHIQKKADYTCIDGLSHIVCEVIKVGALRDMYSNGNISDFDKEHVTPYFRKHVSNFKVEKLPYDFKGLRPDLDKYLTIDNLDDLERYERMMAEVELNTLNFDKIYQWLDKEVGNIIELEKKVAPVVKLAGVPVGINYPTFVIAEIGQNHNGSMQLAKQLIDMAVDCGADAVKFQKRDIPSELTKEAFDRPYDNPNSFGKTYGEHRHYLELNEEQHFELKEYAQAKRITYFCTPCDKPSVEMMERIGCPFYKIASRDLTNIPLLQEVGEKGKPVIISTGMASYEDIDNALEALSLGNDRLIIMQCTSEYPCKLENVNLKAINTLNEKYGNVVGLSDHTSGVIVSSVAIVMGASVIEKHITLDRTMKGTDQPGSLERAGLKKLIEYIRGIELAKGDGVKEINTSTETAKNKLARSITSNMFIPTGTRLTEDMLTLKSPGSGFKWVDKDLLINKIAKVNIEPDVTLTEEQFE